MALRDILPKINKDYREPIGGAMRQAADDGYYVTNSGGDNRIMVGPDVEILPAKPLEALASFETRAFEARDMRDSDP